MGQDVLRRMAGVGHALLRPADLTIVLVLAQQCPAARVSSAYWKPVWEVGSGCRLGTQGHMPKVKYLREVSFCQEPCGSPRAPLLPGDLGRGRELLKVGRDQTNTKGDSMERDGVQGVVLLASRYSGKHPDVSHGHGGCCVPGIWTGTL
jgi:hypothetical protein